jgi:hypothetical protein
VKRKNSKYGGGVFRNGKVRSQNIDAFLKAYERCPMIKTAARSVGIVHTNHYNWLAAVPGYAERFAAVHARAIESLATQVETEAVSRAMEGVRTLVIDRGVPVEVWVNPAGEIVPSPADPKNPGDLKKQLYWEVKKSDGLLQFLLKNVLPDKYGDKQKVDHTSGGKPIQLAPIKLDGDKEL